MGDDFFKIFFVGAFVLMALAGVIMFVQMEQKTQDSREIKAYMESRGKAPVPSTWREKMGNGI